MKSIIHKFITRWFILPALLLPAALIAQESETASKPAKEFVRRTFENPVVINNQTTEVNGHKSLEFMIQHRFGLMKESDDLFGIYAPANIRLGLSYGITDRITVGLGVTKLKMLYDLNGKVALLRQAKENGSPVSVTYYGTVARSDQEKENFLNSENEFKSAYKLSYFHELIVGRKISSKLSLMLAGTYSHFNIIDSAYGQHDFYGVSFAGRYKFSPQSSVIVDFDYLLNVSDIDELIRPKPNLSIGYEVSTGSHQFQIFVATGTQIINQEYRVFNLHEISETDFVLGFNITREWSFK